MIGIVKPVRCSFTLTVPLLRSIGYNECLGQHGFSIVASVLSETYDEISLRENS